MVWIAALAYTVGAVGFYFLIRLTARPEPAINTLELVTGVESDLAA